MIRPAPNRPYESLLEYWEGNSRQHSSITSEGYYVSCWLKQQVQLQIANGEALNGEGLNFCTMSLAGDEEFCRYAVELIARDGGKSADVDVGLFGNSERWKLARACCHAIRHGAVTPLPPELLAIPKASGPGERTIALYQLHDRVIQKVLALISACLIDEQLPEELIGSRQGRNRLMLVDRLRDAVAVGKTHVLKADLRNAFDNVPLARVGQVLACWLPPRLCELSLMSLHPEPAKRGIPQGHCVSPRLLNVYIAQTILPKLRNEFPDVSLTMYVDDLIAAGESQEQMLEMGHRLDTLAGAAGFSLKTPVEESVFDLTEVEVPVEALGYCFTASDNQLNTTVAASGWEHLATHFIELHSDVDAPIRAANIIQQSLTQNGPCLSPERMDGHVSEIVSRLRRCGLGEWPDRAQVSRFYEETLDRQTQGDCAESPRCIVQSVEPSFPPEGVELEELEPEPQFFVYVNACSPWYYTPAFLRGPTPGGWAWAIADSNHTIVEHGRGTLEESSHDELMLNALEALADRLFGIVPAGLRAEIVLDRIKYQESIQSNCQPRLQLPALEQPATLNMRWRHVAHRLNTRDLTVKVVTRKELKLLDSSDHGRMIKTVRFWAEHATVEANRPDSSFNATVPA